MAGLRTLILFPQAFTEMHNLRFLMFYHYHEQFEDHFCNVCIPLGLESLPNALGYLSCSTDLANATEASFHFTVRDYSEPLDTNTIILKPMI